MRTTQFGLRTAGLALVTLLLAGWSTLDAARNVLKPRNPATLALLPGGSGGQVLVYSATIGRADPAKLKEHIVAAARLRLADEPLDSRALNLLAYASDPKASSIEAVKYAKVANMVSRREVFAHLVLINKALQEKNVSIAMDHFDTVLRAKPESEQLFFPYLQKTLPYPEVRTEISRFLSQKSPWAMRFVSFASNQPTSAGFAARIMIDAGDKLGRDTWDIYAGALITRAIAAREYGSAKALLASYPGAPQDSFQTVALAPRSTDERYGFASWQTLSSATGSSTMVRQKGNGSVELSVNATNGANDVVASKVLMLAPGSYRLVQKVSYLEGDRGGATAAWQLSCIDVSAVPQIIPVPGKTGSQTLGPIVVPSNCMVQKLELRVIVPFGGTSYDMIISSLRLISA